MTRACRRIGRHFVRPLLAPCFDEFITRWNLERSAFSSGRVRRAGRRARPLGEMPPPTCARACPSRSGRLMDRPARPTSRVCPETKRHENEADCARERDRASCALSSRSTAAAIAPDSPRHLRSNQGRPVLFDRPLVKQRAPRYDVSPPRFSARRVRSRLPAGVVSPPALKS